MAHAWAKQRTGGPGGLSGFTSSGPAPSASTTGDVEIDGGGGGDDDDDDDDDAASSEG